MGFTFKGKKYLAGQEEFSRAFLNSAYKVLYMESSGDTWRARTDYFFLAPGTMALKLNKSPWARLYCNLFVVIIIVGAVLVSYCATG